MMADMLTQLARVFHRTGSELRSARRDRRPNRRFSVDSGLEGLEGRVSLSTMPGMTITLTNQLTNQFTNQTPVWNLNQNQLLNR
jgi:hypothetical protein